jgi:MbtH protein
MAGMTNPFDDPDSAYVVLVNGRGQHSLWPAFADVPAGWTVTHGADSRQACLDHVGALGASRDPGAR